MQGRRTWCHLPGVTSQSAEGGAKPALRAAGCRVCVLSSYGRVELLSGEEDDRPVLKGKLEGDTLNHREITSYLFLRGWEGLSNRGRMRIERGSHLEM